VPTAAQPPSTLPPYTLTYTQPLAPPALQLVQQRLRQQGAYNGRIDGIWGPDSQAALGRFQQTHGLQVTGQLNQATIASLGIPAEQLLNPGQPPTSAANATLVRRRCAEPRLGPGNPVPPAGLEFLYRPGGRNLGCRNPAGDRAVSAGTRPAGERATQPSDDRGARARPEHTTAVSVAHIDAAGNIRSDNRDRVDIDAECNRRVRLGMRRAAHLPWRDSDPPKQRAGRVAGACGS
jgi:Putative peptidoglycan binding domain